MRGSPALALANFLFAGAIIALGWRSLLADFRRLPVEATVGALQRGEAVEASDIDHAVAVLGRAAATSPAARHDLATALLADAEGPEASPRFARAVSEFRSYLAEVPGDSRAWAELAAAELREGAQPEALQALKMSILTAPWMPGLVMSRCAMGIELYPALDAEGRRLLEEEFRVAAERSPLRLAQLARQQRAILIARVMLIGSPEAMAKFESALAKL
jgi:hypothetical protein